MLPRRAPPGRRRGIRATPWAVAFARKRMPGRQGARPLPPAVEQPNMRTGRAPRPRRLLLVLPGPYRTARRPSSGAAPTQPHRAQTSPKQTYQGIREHRDPRHGGGLMPRAARSGKEAAGGVGRSLWVLLARMRKCRPLALVAGLLHLAGLSMDIIGRWQGGQQRRPAAGHPPAADPPPPLRRLFANVMPGPGRVLHTRQGKKEL